MVGSAFDFLKDTFDGVAFAEGFVAEMRPQLEQSSVQPRRAIDEKFSIVVSVLLFQFRKNIFVKPVFLVVKSRT